MILHRQGKFAESQGCIRRERSLLFEKRALVRQFKCRLQFVCSTCSGSRLVVGGQCFVELPFQVEIVGGSPENLHTPSTPLSPNSDQQNLSSSSPIRSVCLFNVLHRFDRLIPPFFCFHGVLGVRSRLPQGDVRLEMGK